jgi:hypothetical protein
MWTHLTDSRLGDVGQKYMSSVLNRGWLFVCWSWSRDRPKQLLKLTTGCFIMFSVITNIYNKETKGPTLMELFTATGKLKKFFLTTRGVRFVHHGWHGTHRYDIQVLATRVSTWVHRYFFTAAKIRTFRSASSCGNCGTNTRSLTYSRKQVLCVLCTKCTLHSNHRITRVIFQHTKRLLAGSGHFLTTYTRIA